MILSEDFDLHLDKGRGRCEEKGGLCWTLFFFSDSLSPLLSLFCVLGADLWGLCQWDFLLYSWVQSMGSPDKRPEG